MRNNQKELVLPTSGQRGPMDHEMRGQIVHAANEHFRLYGYRKTSVADLAKAIGVSSAYVYRFFDSKQAIGEAICAEVLGKIGTELAEIAAREGSAAQRLRSYMHAAMALSYELFVNERRLQEVVVEAVQQNWCPAHGHWNSMRQTAQRIVEGGRLVGEFERKTPIDEVSHAISDALLSFTHPVLIEHRSREELEAGVVAVGSLILRSLAP
jgi:AcrR family transcriptional regulator